MGVPNVITLNKLAYALSEIKSKKTPSIDSKAFDKLTIEQQQIVLKDKVVEVVESTRVLRSQDPPKDKAAPPTPSGPPPKRKTPATPSGTTPKRKTKANNNTPKAKAAKSSSNVDSNSKNEVDDNSLEEKVAVGQAISKHVVEFMYANNSNPSGSFVMFHDSSIECFALYSTYLLFTAPDRINLAHYDRLLNFDEIIVNIRFERNFLLYEEDIGKSNDDTNIYFKPTKNKLITKMDGHYNCGIFIAMNWIVYYYRQCYNKEDARLRSVTKFDKDAGYASLDTVLLVVKAFEQYLGEQTLAARGPDLFAIHAYLCKYFLYFIFYYT